MRRLGLIALAGTFVLLTYSVEIVSAAGYSNATIAGSFACIGSGYAQIKDANGVSTWVPSSSVAQVTNNQDGSFAGNQTSNTAGQTCSYTLKGTGTGQPDGRGTGSGTVTKVESNPTQCPPGGSFHSVSVIQSPSSFYVLGTDSDFTGWILCTKQTGN